MRTSGRGSFCAYTFPLGHSGHASPCFRLGCGTTTLTCQLCPSPPPWAVWGSVAPYTTTTVVGTHTCQCGGTQDTCSVCNQSTMQWTSSCSSSQVCQSGACCTSTVGQACNGTGTTQCSGACVCNANFRCEDGSCPTGCPSGSTNWGCAVASCGYGGFGYYFITAAIPEEPIGSAAQGAPSSSTRPVKDSRLPMPRTAWTSISSAASPRDARPPLRTAPALTGVSNLKQNNPAIPNPIDSDPPVAGAIPSVAVSLSIDSIGSTRVIHGATRCIPRARRIIFDPLQTDRIALDVP